MIILATGYGTNIIVPYTESEVSICSVIPVRVSVVLLTILVLVYAGHPLMQVPPSSFPKAIFAVEVSAEE